MHTCLFVREVLFFCQDLFPGVHYEFGEPFVYYYFGAVSLSLVSLGLLACSHLARFSGGCIFHSLAAQDPYNEGRLEEEDLEMSGRPLR